MVLVDVSFRVKRKKKMRTSRRKNKYEKNRNTVQIYLGFVPHANTKFCVFPHTPRTNTHTSICLYVTTHTHLHIHPYTYSVTGIVHRWLPRFVYYYQYLRFYLYFISICFCSFSLLYSSVNVVFNNSVG